MWIFLTIILFILSIVISYKIRFKNYKLISIIKSLSKDKTSLFLSLGTKIGVGSIIGTVSSIIIGGPSAVIWMFLFSILTSSLIYVESYLGVKYREKKDNTFIGGPYYILKNGLNNKKLATISFLLLILIYSFLFQMVQTNTIAASIALTMNTPKHIIFIVFFIIVLITISFNVKEILNTMNKIVPFMCMLFLFIAVYSIIKNIDILPSAISKMFSEITDIKSLLSGAVIGIKRSIFMNETLIGTTSLSAAVDTNNRQISINVQVLSTYFITFVIGLFVTLMLTIYLYTNDITNNYTKAIIDVFLHLNGSIGVYILVILFILFGITTILSGYYIGKSNIEHLTNKKKYTKVFKILFITFSLSGIYLSPSSIWNILDTLMLVMILINIYSIIRIGDRSDWQ